MATGIPPALGTWRPSPRPLPPGLGKDERPSTGDTGTFAFPLDRPSHKAGGRARMGPADAPRASRITQPAAGGAGTPTRDPAPEPEPARPSSAQ